MTIFDGILLAAATLAAALTQAATGFGFAVVAMLFFLVALNSTAAVQVAVIVTLVMLVAVLSRIWGSVRPILVGRLALGSLIGYPLGIVAYMAADVFAIKVAVGLLVTGFGAIPREWIMV
jgi:uncharacterized membrane protein YfcA